MTDSVIGIGTRGRASEARRHRRQAGRGTTASRRIFPDLAAGCRRGSAALRELLLPLLVISALATVPTRVLTQVPTRLTEPPVTLIDAGADLDAAALERVRQLTLRTLRELSARFPGTPNAPIRLFLHRRATDLPPDQRHELHAGTPGFARLGRNEAHILLAEVRTRPPGDLRSVLQHELVHVLLDQYAGPRGPLVPRWLHEGLAQVYSEHTYLDVSEESLAYVAAWDRLPGLLELSEDFPVDSVQRRRAYAVARSFTAFLIREGEEATLLRAVDALRDDGDGFGGAWSRASRRSLAHLQTRWRDYIRYDSGAGWRFLFNNCFSYLMILCFVLLALAMIRRLERDRRTRMRMEAAEDRQRSLATELQGPPPPPGWRPDTPADCVPPNPGPPNPGPSPPSVRPPPHQP